MSQLVRTMPPFQIGTLYTLGYAGHNAAEQLTRWMRDERTMLIDIRYRPRSRWYPQWNRNTLAGQYGTRYCWEQRLGNLHYRDREKGILLAQRHQEAVQMAAELLYQGTSLVLLCACKEFRSCHRSHVAKLIQDALDALREGRQV